MRSIVTAKIKISSRPEIVKTIKVFTKGIKYCIDQAWKRGINNNVKLHPFVYKHLRKTLPSQLAIACIKQSCGMIKKAKNKPIIKKVNVKYHFNKSARIKGNILKIRTLEKSIKLTIKIPECYQIYFDSWKICESLLRVDKKGRSFFLFTFSKEVDIRDCASQNHILGIDLGVNNIAVTSDNRFFHSNKVKQIKRRFQFLRNKLQVKGTQSAKRLLKKISGREQRFMTWTNHNISKSIVTKFEGDKIIMENLKGIRKKRRGKTVNTMLSNWSFSQLQSFITYKANMQGITVEYVKPNFTSQICHRCGQLGTRSFGCFSCNHCKLHNYNSDLNASRNLAHPKLVMRQASVTMPHIQMNEIKDILASVTAIDIMNKIIN